MISQIDQSTSEWFRLREVLSSDSGSDKDYVVPKKLTKPAQPLKVTPILIILSIQHASIIFATLGRKVHRVGKTGKTIKSQEKVI